MNAIKIFTPKESVCLCVWSMWGELLDKNDWLEDSILIIFHVMAYKSQAWDTYTKNQINL